MGTRDDDGRDVLVDALGAPHAPASAAPRIVSLVPSITELLCDLGLAGALVGRTGFCIHPREVVRRIPKVGGTKALRLDRIRALAPTHVIANVEENLREDVAALREFVPDVVVTYPRSPEDNVPLYRLLGALFGKVSAAATLADRFLTALEAARHATAAWPRERVLYLIWRAPWMAVGRDTYIARTLAAVGWDTEPLTLDDRYPTLPDGAGWPACDRVLLSSEPFRFEHRHRAEAAALAGLPVERVTLIDGEMTSWYGSRAIAGMQWLAQERARLTP